ncbi:hypothetical protein [Angustibacter aerolatus]
MSIIAFDTLETLHSTYTERVNEAVEVDDLDLVDELSREYEHELARIQRAA